MATDEKLDEKEEGQEADDSTEEEKSSSEEAVALEPTVEPKPVVETRPDDNGPAPTAPVQLGYRRYVYAAYMAGAIGVAFLYDEGHRLRLVQDGAVEAALVRPVRRAGGRGSRHRGRHHRRHRSPSTTGGTKRSAR